MGRFIEITQDSAGVIEKENKELVGFHTGGIQSCLVTVYECEKAHILVHDSGQLKISDICKLIKGYGNVQKVTATFGPNLNSEHHQKRFNEILEKIGYGDQRVDVLQSPVATFSFQYPLNNKAEISPNTTPDYVEKIPDKDKRISIIEVNNFFLKPNSQQLELDVQFINGSYQPPKGLDHSVNDLLKIVKEQPGFFFPNLAFLEKAHGIGLLKMPEELLKTAKECRVSQFMYRIMNSEELKQQKTEFQKFIKSA